MPNASGFGYVAAGDINPQVFVKQGAGPGKVLQATAGDHCIGVSGHGTRTANYAGLDDGLHAKLGENCRVYADGEITTLKSGAAFAIGVRLKSDATGRGIAVAAVDEQYGAVALDLASDADQFIPVRIELGIR